MDLLEREEELGALSSLLTDTADGAGGRLVLVSGEAGIGKTALLSRFCGEEARGVRTLWGACERLFTPRALGPFLDVAEHTGGELAEVAAEGGRPHAFVAALLRELARARPTVLVLEDLHWADEATLDVLRLLAGRLAEVPALVLASFRDDELARDHPLRLVLGELAPGRIERLALRPLTERAVGRLAEPYGADDRALYARTAGNPFFVTEVLAAGDARIPDSVRDAVLARAAHLPAGARRLLEAVAVVPAQIELWLLERIAQAELPALEPCLWSGVLRSDERSIAFRHELARLAIEETTPPDRRLALHRAVVEALASPPVGRPDPARLAHHAEAAGDADAVHEHAPAAAARASTLGAHVEAAAQYARALRFADRLPLARQARLWDRYAYERHLTNHLEDALTGNAEALARRRALGQRLHEADALRFRSKLLWFTGRAGEAEETGCEAVSLLEQTPGGLELGRAYAQMANLALLRHRRPAVESWAAKAAAEAGRTGDLGVHASALNSLGTIECLAGDEAGLAKLEQSLALARSSYGEEHIARALVNYTGVALDTRRYDLAEHYLAEGLAYTEERELASYRAYLLSFEARLALDRGHIAQAIRSAEAAVPPRGTMPLLQAVALALLGRARARRGDHDAQEPLDAALERAPRDDLGILGPVAVARAEHAWLTDRTDAIAAETDEAFRLAREREELWLTAELAYWRAKAGLAVGASVEAARPFALQLAGEAVAASEAWAAIGCPYEAAVARGDADSPDDLRRALDELQRLGATPAARMVARRLRELGVRQIARGPRTSTRENPGLLTSRELEVLQLLETGLRNAEIAGRLYIAPKTVDHHVSAILRKLGVHSRLDAVAEARRRSVATR
jgi:predicted ATPase/DNA-binding CsgD family transcriptional regulator